jgi:uncharacterized protein (TIGR02145 family)
MKMYLLLFLMIILISCSDDKSSSPTTNNIVEVTIGSQTWMTKNLNVTTYSTGDTIPQVTSDSKWRDLTTGAWCYYNNDPANEAIYGKLYNWYAVNDPRGLAPEGWHVATVGDWETLTNYLGGNETTGGKLKEAGTSHWESPNTGASNSTGFSAMPGGFRTFALNGYFFGINEGGYWWTPNEGTTYPSYATLKCMEFNNSQLINYEFLRFNGCSVRCVKDNLID